MNMKVENEMALPITKSVTVMLLEPYAGKLARTVLRGEGSSNAPDLLDIFLDNPAETFQQFEKRTRNLQSLSRYSRANQT